MSAADIGVQVTQVSAQIVAINGELDDLLKERETIDVKRLDLRKKREGLSQLLNSLGVQQRVATHEEAAASARIAAEQLQASAKQSADDLAEKNKRADELIAKLEAQASKAAEPAAEVASQS